MSGIILGNVPQNSLKGAWIGIFKQNSHDIEIHSRGSSDFYEIFKIEDGGGRQILLPVCWFSCT